ncbi:hypothetical protein L596_012010 [Steinernema carpocapsae]|uniref:G-protein coupled receptors family 1 profile domain-containing protein n=1 Tax=Steinernema carpocapsae TaxID=34508 RepID=A0A4U5NW45_STECR|nr:hypothetical protein L596_012010 [Steinernema carpocapsae]
MLSTEKIICSFILIPNIIINCLIIYISIRHVKRSILQIFALNLCVPTLCYLLYASGALIASLIWPSDDVALGIKNVLFVLLGCHILTITTSLIATLSNRQSKQVISQLLPIAAVNWKDIVEGAFETCSLSLSYFMYFVCISAILAFRKASSNTNHSQKRKVQLIATLAYITPPNILLLPNSICTDLFAACFGTPPVFQQFCELKIYHDDSLLQARLFVTTFTVLVAFIDYRRALKQMVRNAISCLPIMRQPKKIITVTRMETTFIPKMEAISRY